MFYSLVPSDIFLIFNINHWYLFFNTYPPSQIHVDTLLDNNLGRKIPAKKLLFHATTPCHSIGWFLFDKRKVTWWEVVWIQVWAMPNWIMMNWTLSIHNTIESWKPSWRVPWQRRNNTATVARNSSDMIIYIYKWLTSVI